MAAMALRICFQMALMQTMDIGQAGYDIVHVTFSLVSLKLEIEN